MRLRRLKLENWRGVDSCEVEFGEGVTLIEGPNEIGKSSLIEALLTLIRELDSSAKQAIKAVKPVDRDVGSTVEAEIEAGEHRFVYRKTYNRDRQTTLDILAPAREQLTGREAHERAEGILRDSVDLDLWEALLVDQGEKIAPADLRDSAGLSRALDEAAGTGSVGEEDTDLFEAAQAEYEKYFTLKAGKPRFDGEEKSVGKAKARVEAAADALRGVEADADRHERLAADVRDRERALPQLKKSAGDYETAWRDVGTARNALALKQKDLDAAATAEEQAKIALGERRALRAAIAEAETAIAEAEKSIEPGRARIEDLRRSMESARLVLDDRKARRSAARQRLATAQADTRHLRQLEELEAARKTLYELASLATTIERSAATVAKLAIDPEGLDRLQAAENDLRLLEAQRDLAATRLRITAERDQAIRIGDESVDLRNNRPLERQLASRTEVGLPGVATLEIEPPRAAADLETRVAEAKDALDALLKEYGVRDRGEAATNLTKKQAAEGELDRAKRREQELLGDRSKAELEQRARKLDGDVADYADARAEEPPLPVSVEAAEAAADRAQEEFDSIEERLRETEDKAGSLQQELSEAEAAIRQAELELSGRRATLDDRKSRLEEQRKAADDDELEAALAAARSALDEEKKAVGAAQGRLEALNPERIETLYENAQAAFERAEGELRNLATELAIVADRLEQSQANGRFEALEQAERDLDEAETRYAGTKRRADAAQRLWDTLNRHRDAARQAYVRPLKDAVERLGRIVFGGSFEVAIGEDWAIETRTLDGRTLPYGALSIGAKEQLGILTRLAAAQIVAKQGGVPLIIDDALGFSDPGRLATMGAAISAAGKDCQVIILTCTPGRFTHVGSAKVVGI